MSGPTGVLRTAARAAQDTIARSSPSARTKPAAPPHPSTWVKLDSVKAAKRYLGRTAPPVPKLSPLALPKPPFRKVTNPTVFAHPSLKAYALPVMEEEENAASTDFRKRRRSTRTTPETFERHEALGKEMIDMVVTELLFEKYAKMSPEEIQQIRHLLVGEVNLAHLCRHYDLASHLHADPIARDQLAETPSVLASLFRSYAAGLHFQEGLAYARQWLRQCFRSSLNDEFDALRHRVAEDERLKLRESEKKRPDEPLARLDRFLQQRKVQPQWRISVKGIPPRQVFKAELRFMGARALGGGRTMRAAKSQAAAVALGLQDKPEALADPDTMLWSPRLYNYCRQRNIKPKFDTVVVNNPVWRCQLLVDDRFFEAMGIGKKVARANAAKAALEELAPALMEKYLAEDEGRVQDNDEAEEFAHAVLDSK
ncbi:hypothetical protein JCM8097_004635 [Rhodosporidiobolus ruineniae]